MKLHIKTISVVTTAGLLFTLMSSIPVNASTNIAVSSANFPDQEFREYVYEYCDGNHNGFLTQEEIDEVDTISVYDTNIKDLTGIGYFTKLEYLICFNNQLTTLDTSNNKNLTFIDCSGNNLTSINVKANTKLQYLACYDNNLKSLDISGNPSLMYLEAQNNQIATLNISNNNNLLMAYKYGDTFDCDENGIGYDYGEEGSGVFFVDKTTKIVTTKDSIVLSGTAHVQNVGDQTATFNDGVLKLGTRGRSLRMESITINFVNNTGYAGGMEYRVHIQNIGWTDWMPAGSFAGTRGQALRLEGIEIRLTGDLANFYSVQYCAHIQDYGDGQGWVRDGALAGTTGESKRVEEIRVRVVPFNSAQSADVAYRVHRQDYGWETAWISGGKTSGTTGQSKRLESIELNLSGNTAPYSGGIRYCTHVQNIGWQGWKYDGELSGTQGQSLRLEAIKIELTGEMANHYDVYYRVHAQNYGWLGWAVNGEMSGTSGQSLRLEAIQIVLVPKGGTPPTSYDGVPNSDLGPAVIAIR